jgi:2'-5' RNA ligase
MRVFVACDLSISTVENLVLLQEDLSKPLTQAGVKPRWVEAANIHMTLKFLGERDPDLVYQVREKLRDLVRRHRMFEVETLGTGCFPDYRTARVLWAGTRSGREAVIAAVQDVEATLAELGIEPERREFKPHVTLARIRTRRKRVDLEPILTPYRDTVFGTSLVKDFALYQSQLQPNGVVYRVLERFPLGG